MTPPPDNQIVLVTHESGYEQTAVYIAGKWFIPGTEKEIHAKVVKWRGKQ